MFVSINFLSMIKIGIIVSDTNAAQWVKLVKNIDDFELTGWYNIGCEISDTSYLSDLIAYPSVDALFNYVDAIVVSCQFDDAVYIICKCLKSFKHVFLADVQHLKYVDFTYLLKIAEESNVRVFAGIGGLWPELPDNQWLDCQNIQCIDLNHTFSLKESLCVGRLSLTLLRDANFITHLVKANVKKIDAKGWGFAEPGAGMLHATIDFDNGTSVRLLLCNSMKRYQIQAVVYGKSEIVTVSSENNIVKISREPLNDSTLDNNEEVFALECAMLKEFKQFLSAIKQEQSGLISINNKHKAIQLTHLIQEKINHIATINIFCS